MAVGERYPSYEEICECSAGFARRNSGIARVESLGTSAEGRDVFGVAVTDPSVAEEDKQVAIVVCGRHGDELGTRGVGAALLEWLAADEGAETIRRQMVIVVPVANPDGCVREEFFAPTDALSEVEERTLGALAERRRPDAVVDVHSLGGSDTQAVIAAHTSRCAADEFIHTSLATQMASAAAVEGYAFDLHAVAFAEGYNNFFAGMCYQRFHSLAFGMEVNHYSLAPDEAAAGGAAAVRGLLAAGNRRTGWQRGPGYPNGILIGDLFTSIRPAGSDAAARRRSRSEIWQNRNAFTIPKRHLPDRHTVKLTAEYSGQGLSVPWALCCRIRGRPEIRGVRLNRCEVEWDTCRDDCSTYVFAGIEGAGAQRHELVIEI